MRLLALACLLAVCGRLGAATATWSSPLLGRELTLTLLEPAKDPAGQPVPVVFYLTGLASPRAGTEADEPILRDLRAAGHLVVVLDYAHDPRARVPELNRDLAALRRALQKKTLLADRALDARHLFILPEGCRLLRDVVYYRDPQRTLALDIIYPSQPARPVGAVLEFSCDNTDRMGNFSLDFCTDTLLPAAASAGFAAVMADHPVAAPYAGLDAMPDCARKIKAAVRTLRATGAALGLSGRIVPVGFSRGSGMALMLATTMDRAEFEGFGEHIGTDSSVQGAIVMSGRFTYLDLRAADPMISRYEKAWGPRATSLDTWRAHGALDYLNAPTVPLFLTINATESPDALHQMAVLRRRLAELGSPFTDAPEAEPRGHKMPLAPEVLNPLFGYLNAQLNVAPEASPASQSNPP